MEKNTALFACIQYMLYSGSARHKVMVQTFWHTNHIRHPKTSASESVDSSQKASPDAQKLNYTILQDYENDIKKRFRASSGGAPAKWKEWLESQKTGSKKAAKSCVDESVTGSSPNSDVSLELQMPSSTKSSASTLEWRTEAFLLSSDDYQRYSLCVLITVCN